jgi:hypothetical protein
LKKAKPDKNRSRTPASPRPASRTRTSYSAMRRHPFAPAYRGPRRLRCGPRTCHGPSAPSVSRAPCTPARTPRMRMATWSRPRPRGALHSLVSRSLCSAVKGTNRNASSFLLCAPPVSPSLPLSCALLRPSSCPLSSSSCPPGAPQHRDVAACPSWPELHREDRQQRCSCRSSAAGARRPCHSPIQAPKRDHGESHVTPHYFPGPYGPSPRQILVLNAGHGAWGSHCFFLNNSREYSVI